jgi:hypothetical protein
LQLPAKGMQAPRAACRYSALVQHFIARRYSAAAGDALSTYRPPKDRSGEVAAKSYRLDECGACNRSDRDCAVAVLCRSITAWSCPPMTGKWLLVHLQVIPLLYSVYVLSSLYCRESVHGMIMCSWHFSLCFSITCIWR